jgi:xanthine dehydrogenase YagT iron-sulfur-binding subunit
MQKHDPGSRPGEGSPSRRDFLRGSGLAAATTVLTGRAAEALDAQAQADKAPVVVDTATVELKVNGKPLSCEVEPRTTLLEALRNELDVTGPKKVCDRASCGACTVILDGQPVYSCTTLALTCQGHDIQTAEGFDTGESSVPHAFHQNDALMCGYCTPGFVTACKAFLDQNQGKEVTLDDVKQALDGNICRCGTYIGVFQAALDAAKAMKGA